jgi:hypothetical protein
MRSLLTTLLFLAFSITVNAQAPFLSIHNTTPCDMRVTAYYTNTAGSCNIDGSIVVDILHNTLSTCIPMPRGGAEWLYSNTFELGLLMCSMGSPSVCNGVVGNPACLDGFGNPYNQNGCVKIYTSCNPAPSCVIDAIYKLHWTPIGGGVSNCSPGAYTDLEIFP